MTAPRRPAIMIRGQASRGPRGKEIGRMSEELDRIVEGVKAAPGKVKELLDKTDIDEKIVEGAKDVIGKIGSLFSGKGKE